ncbi:MAG: pyruvate, phosphate dikinase [Clostridia bacterium]|nr:pyruvate, phosphate dikinase [Clostridia bacterium]
MKKKYVYLFSEGNASMRELLGGKGANLAEMTRLGLPVPQGFTVSTEACTLYHQNGCELTDEIIKQIEDAVAKVGKEQGKVFGDDNNPLLLSVRSGARVSMPGMMDTILNLGLNENSVKTLAKNTNNERFAYDCYRKFIQMYSNVVMQLDGDEFEKMIDAKKQEKGIKLDADFTAEDLKDLIAKFKAYYKKNIGEDFPNDSKMQLINSVKSVFRSWDNQRAKAYRRMNDIPSEWGTAVNIQTMVFGNMGDTSGTGVAFTRNPSTGENVLYGEYLMNAQGEDVVAGIRTPEPIAKLKLQNEEVYNQFVKICSLLEHHYKDMQDMEFTIENGKLWMLQTRSGKRTGTASLQIAVDMVKEGLIDEKEALMLISPKQLEDILHPTFVESELKGKKAVAVGLPASPGCASGRIVFSADEAVEAKKNGEEVILVRLETSPEDIEGMHSAVGLLTIRGGMTSHAAVVARGMGTPCITGCSEIEIDEENKKVKFSNGVVLGGGDFISIDAEKGNVYAEKITTIASEISGNLQTVLGWADKYRKLGIRVNADTKADAMQAVRFGAEGIGLCRTEHMFFESSRILAMREMILADDVVARQNALDKLLPFQQNDFEELFTVMQDKAVTIRLLDPPLHEFLPKTKEEKEQLAKSLNIKVATIDERINALHEFNPMMGHRGCRLDITYPEIAVMQTKAIIQGAINVQKKLNICLDVEIMIPLVSDVKELKYVKDIIIATANDLITNANVELKYYVGTMMELPRAMMVADEIAKEAEFFSFGTNDLTQMSYGFSRDDAGKFLKSYYEKGVFANDPFASIDEQGVGKLMEIAVEKGRSARKDLKIGICGEHGGNPKSIEFCHKIGLNYVSCSPYRVIVAKVASAQANIRNPKK